MTVLTWDPGQTPSGTVLLPNPNTNGGNYWFQIIPQSPVVGVWRTALNVLAGQAGVYLSQGLPPNTYNHSYSSANAGSNGFVVDASQFQAGQNWYILVNASPNALWTLLTGDIYVYNLGSLAADNSSSTNAAIGAEGMIFCQTTIPSAVLAWQLWINGAPNTMFVKKSAAPDPVSHDLMQSGQMLVVPPYLAGGTFNGTYFIGVSGSPGTTIKLDSRQQPVTPLPFSSLTNVVVAATNFPYITYQVQVPVQQIAWQLNLTPTSGNPAIAVRNALVANEFRNDAFSETPQNVGASVTLVPPPAGSGPGTPGLSDGTWYVTIYSTAPYSCAFTNANPVITPESYVFQATDDAPNRAGWRYYTLTNINQQLGSLGWALSLSNQVPGSEIAIRRNAVPGQWNYRNSDDYYPSSSLGYVDLSSIYGLLQQPGHQADIWYIGVYTPDEALGGFVLDGSLLTGQPMPFDGAGNSRTRHQPASRAVGIFSGQCTCGHEFIGVGREVGGSEQRESADGGLPGHIAGEFEHQWRMGCQLLVSGRLHQLGQRSAMVGRIALGQMRRWADAVHGNGQSIAAGDVLRWGAGPVQHQQLHVAEPGDWPRLQHSGADPGL